MNFVEECAKNFNLYNKHYSVEIFPMGVVKEGEMPSSYFVKSIDKRTGEVIFERPMLYDDFHDAMENKDVKPIYSFFEFGRSKIEGMSEYTWEMTQEDYQGDIEKLEKLYAYTRNSLKMYRWMEKSILMHLSNSIKDMEEAKENA